MNVNTLRNGTPTQTQKIDIKEEPRTRKRFWKGLQDTGAVAVAGVGYLGVNSMAKVMQSKMSSTFLQACAESSQIVSREHAEAIFKASGLLDKGVDLVDYSGRTKSCKAMANLISAFERLKNQKTGLRKTLTSLLELREETVDNMIINGSNACYHPNLKEIRINVDKLGAALPHEMGHAKNFNGHGVAKALSKMRGFTLLALPILLVALFRKPKDKREESTTFVGKTLDFVKDNATALTAGCFAPTVIEEGIASIKGARMAKDILSPDKLKALNNFNFTAWKTYAITAGAAIVSVWAVNKLKNLLCSDDTPDNLNVANENVVQKENLATEEKKMELVA